METTNKQIACTPFEVNSIKTEVTNRFVTISQKQKLTCLTVVFDSDEGYSVGDKVWVKGDCFAHAWAKEVFEINEKKFILMPSNFVLAHEFDGHCKDRPVYNYEMKEKY